MNATVIHSDPVINAAWIEHAMNLAKIAAQLESVLANMPCYCEDGLCEHCTRVAWLAVDSKTACQEAILRCSGRVTVAA